MLWYSYLGPDILGGFDNYKYNARDTSPLSNYGTLINVPKSTATVMFKSPFFLCLPVCHPFWNRYGSPVP